MIMDLTLLMMLLSLPVQNIPNWTIDFTDITTEFLTQDSDPSLPKNFDVSMATP